MIVVLIFAHKHELHQQNNKFDINPNLNPNALYLNTNYVNDPISYGIIMNTNKMKEILENYVGRNFWFLAALNFQDKNF